MLDQIVGSRLAVKTSPVTTVEFTIRVGNFAHACTCHCAFNMVRRWLMEVCTPFHPFTTIIVDGSWQQ